MPSMMPSGSMFLPYNFQGGHFGGIQQPAGGVPTAVGNNSLASRVNQFMTGQAIMPFQQNLPGYANMVGQRSENALSMLRGEIPNDVISQISQGAAERGIMGGAPASPNANAAYLRALGLTSLDMMGEGSKQLSQSIQDTPVPELWNPMSLYVPQTLAAQQVNYARQGAAQQQAQSAPPKLEYSYSETRPGLTPTYKYKYFA